MRSHESKLCVNRTAFYMKSIVSDTKIDLWYDGARLNASSERRETRLCFAQALRMHVACLQYTGEKNKTLGCSQTSAKCHKFCDKRKTFT